MDKTALQAVISGLTTIQASYTGDNHDYFQGRSDMLDFIIKRLKQAIPEERQQIEEAFNAGFKEGELEVQDYNPNYYNAENYYQSKYTESKGE